MRQFLRRTVQVNVVTYFVLVLCTTYLWMTSVYDYVVWERPMAQCRAEARETGYQYCEINGKTIEVFAKVKGE